ncbi:MAG: acetylornithine deacetylase [Pseudomonadota bacterium]
MTEILDAIIPALRPLIEADTRNPPRAIERDGALINALINALPDFEIDVRDLDDGCFIIDCKRGASGALFNVHLDTVPVADGWTHNPHELTLTEDRAYGLGTCDTKGAAAALIALAQCTDLPLRFVFTTDEEAGKSRCIHAFLETPPPVDLAVVAEPTNATARFEHRGICSVQALFEGDSAHSSESTRISAIHEAAAFIAGALALPEASENRLNFGRIEGGLKPNMVAAHTELLFGFRTRPGLAHTDVLDVLSPHARSAKLTTRFVGPSFPSDHDGPSSQAVAVARQAAETIGIPIGEPVNFWTEASLFAAAGVPTLVLGAGSITQAHNADEFVLFEQLTTLYTLYERIARHYG